MRLTAAARRGAMTPALPVPYPALGTAGLRLRRGQLSLTVAAPGVGKSMLWLNMAMQMGLPTLYWSADTDQHDVMMRALAVRTRNTTEEIDAYYRDSEKSRDYYDKELRQVGIDWVFDNAMPIDLVAERMNAFAEVRGEYPHLVILDNLSNAVDDVENDRAEQTKFIVEAQRMARKSKAHFAILGHAEGQYEDGTKPIPASGAYNKLAKLPEVMLTLYKQDAAGTQMGVCVVKQRGGKTTGTAHPVRLDVDFSRAFVSAA